MLTLRNQGTGEMRNYKDILDLAIHELTHTTCNDIYWKEDNHKYPYPVFHSIKAQMSDYEYIDSIESYHKILKKWITKVKNYE
jgi:hypothetical protein